MLHTPHNSLKAKDVNGQRQADFIDCIAWDKQAEFLQQWFTKGMLAIVTGRIQSRNWQDKNGNKRISIEINCEEISFGETKKSRESGTLSLGGNGEPVPPTNSPLPPDDSGFQQLAEGDDSDVPF